MHGIREKPGARKPVRRGYAAQRALHAGFSLYERDEYAQATVRFREALVLAQKENDTASEADAHRGLGLALSVQGRYVPARKELKKALAQFQTVSDALGVAHTRQNLGMLLSTTSGDWKTIRQLYGQALQEYEGRHDTHDEASVMRAMDFDPSLSAREQEQNIQRGLALLHEPGDRQPNSDLALEGGFLEDWGDALFGEGDYAAAIEKLESAKQCFERAGDRFSLARVLTSEGRIYRAHGLPSRALALYERALAIQRRIGDAFGATQSMNAIAVAYDLMGQRERALAEYEAALKQARRTSSSRLVAFLAANIAGERLEMGRYALAEQGLKRALAEEKSPYLQAYRLGQLSQAEFGMGHYQSSADFATRALRLQAADRDETLQIFYWRARSEQKLGRARAALADINSSLQILEHIRSQLAPDDSMKQHFTDRSGFLYDFAIALNYQLGKKREALAIAEAGRARASEDLLASRNTHPQPKERKTIAATGALVARAEHGTQSSGRAAARLTLRGAAPRGPTRRSAKAERLDGGEPHLQSFASTQPFSVTQMVAAARQMRSTILSYWTGERATYIWVVKADGSIGSARVGVSRARLEALIRKLWPQLRLETKGRSMPRAAQGSALRVAPGVGRIGSLVGRGGDELTFGLADKRNWRELYGLLIRPVAKYLPQTGSLLTLEPHGPLLLLPFAALMNERGQYLIERFRMNYLPSLSLFPYVEQQEKRATKLKPYFLLIADPDRVAPDPLGEPLPALPGARREVAKIAHRLPAREVTLLVGRRAQERRVDRDLPNATVIHFATHAIFDNRSPSESYLALGAGGVDTGTQGRLTAAHVYSLHLHADLVFLSACRTGMGEVSGDGVAGLTRAFFYAGAASLVASLWDVSDETTVRLVPDFYRYWLQDHDKSQALREAQLHLLRDLRAGRIRMRTPYGRYALPEDPVLWASFVLEGEP